MQEDFVWHDPEMVRIVEPLCYVGVHHGDVDMFIKNVELMIDSPLRREVEHDVQTSYYGSVLSAAWHIDVHLQRRARHIGAHDVGRAISVYRDLVTDPDRWDLAQSIKDGVIKSLKELGVRRPLRERADALMCV
jgi:hypothetical protein